MGEKELREELFEIKKSLGEIKAFQLVQQAKLDALGAMACEAAAESMSRLVEDPRPNEREILLGWWNRQLEHRTQTALGELRSDLNKSDPIPN